MIISDEIIKVLEYLCMKLGLTIDWTSENVLPYIQQLAEKFVKWRIATSCVYIGIAFAILVVCFILFCLLKKPSENDVDLSVIRVLIIGAGMVIMLVVSGFQACNIVEAYYFPEKAIYEYIQENINQKR